MEFTIEQAKEQILKQFILELKARNQELSDSIVPTIHDLEIRMNQNIANEIEAGREIIKALEHLREDI